MKNLIIALYKAFLTLIVKIFKAFMKFFDWLYMKTEKLFSFFNGTLIQIILLLLIIPGILYLNPYGITSFIPDFNVSSASILISLLRYSSITITTFMVISGCLRPLFLIYEIYTYYHEIVGYLYSRITPGAGGGIDEDFTPNSTYVWLVRKMCLIMTTSLTIGASCYYFILLTI